MAGAGGAISKRFFIWFFGVANRSGDKAMRGSLLQNINIILIMKHLHFFICLFSTHTLLAQITVTNVTFPSAGDTLRYKTDSNPPALNLGTTGGGNQVWDFTDLQGGPVQTTVYLTAAGGNGSGSFPLTTLRTTNALQETYYRKTATAFENLGTIGDDPLNLGINTTIRYQPSLPERRAPQQFFDIHTVESDLSYAVPTGALADSLLGQLGALVDSFRFRIETKRLDVVDGWGTCNIPGGQFEVLREKRTTTTSTSIEVHSFLGWVDLSGLLGGGGSSLLDNIGKDTTVAYHFFSNAEKEEIAVVTMNDSGTEPQSVRFKWIENVVSNTNDMTSDNPRVVATPNPAKSSTSLLLEHFLPGTYQVVVWDGTGKNLYQQSVEVYGNTLVAIDLLNSPAGLLLVQILDKQGDVTATCKLIRYE
jgi:hypothetical protein